MRDEQTSQVYPWRQARLAGRSAIRRPYDDDTSVRRDRSPVLVSDAEPDLLCDEGVAFGRKLRQAEVDVSVLRSVGIIHDFVVINALAETTAARDAVAKTTRALTSALRFSG